MNAAGSLSGGALALAKLLRVLVRPLDSGASTGPLIDLAAELGWILPDPPPPVLLTLREAVLNLTRDAARLEDLLAADAGELAVASTVADLISSVAKLSSTLPGLKPSLAAQLPAAYVAATDLPAQFAERLLRKLIADGLVRAAPVAARLMEVAGLIDVTMIPSDPATFKAATKLQQFRWDRIGKFLHDPVDVMKEVYGWGSPDVDLARLHRAAFSLSFALGYPGKFDYPSAGLLKAIAPTTGSPEPDRTFEFTLFDVGLLGANLLLTAVPKASPGEAQGIAAAITTQGGTGKLSVPVSGRARMEVTATLDASAGVALILKPGEAPRGMVNLAGGATPVTGGELTAGIIFERFPSEDPFSIFAIPGVSLTAREFHALAGIGVSGKGGLDPRAELGIKKGQFELKLGDADSFISKILPGDGIKADFDLTLGWSNEAGIFVEGNAGLSIAIPLHLSIGPAELTALYLDAGIVGGDVALTTAIGANGKLGPLAASVDRIGLQFFLTFPANGGNLGPANLEAKFKPPNGIGLSIDAGVAKGGGYLYIDADRGEYAGALELRILDFISASAVGIITTRMPDGSKGFSFLAIISVEFNPGIQLGFGFTLIGVGGLVGLNRTMQLDALVQSARSGSIDSVLFPKDVVANAPRIISDLRTFFPPADGIFLIGPMLKLGWGTPTLISLSLGVIIEIPGNIALVGKLQIAIPTEDAALIVIKVAFIGALEFDKDRGWFFATLYESRILFMPLDGGLGVLAQFGDDSNFIVSAGGFHPSYNPPALPFPSIARIAISILNTPLARIRVEAYFAVTSNTVQFGAHAELYFGISIANIEGHLAFDALFQFSPFHFIITISASLSVKLFGTGMFSVRFHGTLEGTSPWHVEGSGSISLLFWDVDVDFSHSWGDPANTKIDAIPVLGLIAGELAKAENWTAVLPGANQLLVSVRSTDGSELVLHPLGRLRIAQRAVPLGVQIDKVGSAPSSDGKLFTLDASTDGMARHDVLRESFAIAQFQNLDDSARLSASDYQKEDAGIELEVTGSQALTGFVAKRIARYEQIIIDTNVPRLAWRFVTLIGGLFSHFLINNAAARSPLSARTRDLKHLADPKIEIAPESYVVVSQADNSPLAGVPASFSSKASAAAFMQAQQAKDPSFINEAHIVRPHEMKLAA